MTRKTWLAALAGAGVLVAGSLTASNAHAVSAAPATVQALGAYTASGDLVAGRHTVRSKSHHGRGGDGHGGEHSGGARCSDKRRSTPATPVTKKKSDRDRRKGNTHGDHRSGGRSGGHQHGTGCHYPPSSSPQVVLSGPNHTHAGRTVTLTGKVSLNGCQMSRVKLGLYSSHDGATNWVMIRAGEVDRQGNFSFQVPSYATHHYQAVVAAGDGYAPSSSKILPLELW